jgi:hypothetical protein
MSYLYSKYRLNRGEASVLRETGGSEMCHRTRGQEDEGDVEQEGVHPCRVEATLNIYYITSWGGC